MNIELQNKSWAAFQTKKMKNYSRKKNEYF